MFDEEGDEGENDVVEEFDDDDEFDDEEGDEEGDEDEPPLFDDAEPPPPPLSTLSARISASFTRSISAAIVIVASGDWPGATPVRPGWPDEVEDDEENEDEETPRE